MVRQGNVGFTLVEAILAVAIMSMTAFSFMALVSRCAGVARRARDYHAAVAVLDKGVLDHPMLWTNEVYDNEVSRTPYGERGYEFERLIEEVEDEEDMFVVRTRAIWTIRGKEFAEEVAGYIYSTNHP